MDKLISDVLRLANGEKEDPTQVGGNAKLPVGKAAPKKEPVKAPTKKPGQPEIVEEKKSKDGLDYHLIHPHTSHPYKNFFGSKSSSSRRVSMIYTYVGET